MLRQIISINTKKCTGCGLCVKACHEGAIGLKDGKAVLLRDDYCDGLGDCLPACPENAITFETREAVAYDADAVAANMSQKKTVSNCPGSAPRTISSSQNSTTSKTFPNTLTNWPVQIKLSPIHAPYFDNAHLLIAADCTAYAYGNFHHDFIQNRTTLIGCPKLDAVDYSEKLTAILTNNSIQTITLTRMTVPCCGGLEQAVQNAIKASGKAIPLQIIILSPDGQIIETR